LGCVLFQSESGNTVRLDATNLDDYVGSSIETIQNSGGFKALVPFWELNKLTKGYQANEQITLLQENETLILIHPASSSHLRQRLDFIALDDFPPLPTPKFGESVPVDDGFKAAVLRAFSSASTDENRYVLNHAFIDVSDPKAHYIIATDGRHMFCANSFKL